MKYTLHPPAYLPAPAPAPAPDRRVSRRVGADYAPDGGGHPLTRRQKAVLSILARVAWEKRGRPGPSADEWRREEAEAACGRRISTATQRDFPVLKARFQDRALAYGQAFRTLVRGENNPHRVALHRLASECETRGLPLAYPEAICRRQYKCSLEEASAAQIWRLIFTVKNRRSAK